MKKLSELKLDIPIFNFDIDFRFCKLSKVKDILKNEYDVICSDDLNGAGGACFNLEAEYGISNTLMIAIEDFFDDDQAQSLSILTHECLHAAMMIIANRGMKVNQNNDELVAYLQQYIIKNVIKNLKLEV